MSVQDALHARFNEIETAIDARVPGQTEVVHRLLVAVLAGGHVLLDGPPGAAKTRVALLLSHAFQASFQRVQFTPDLLPSDLTGTQIYNAREHRFEFHPGPLFHDFILADEINRAPAKVQAALLEAMAEGQITAGGRTHALGDLFFVIATQNPVDDEGTYALPSAQLDRFAMRIPIHYPDLDAETAMLSLVFDERRQGQGFEPALRTLPRLAPADLLAARAQVLDVHLSAPLTQYLIRLVHETRARSRPDDSGPAAVVHPVSPRGTIALAHVARARAWLDGRDHVLPEDIQALAANALAHRIGLADEALLEGLDGDSIVREALEQVPAA